MNIFTVIKSVLKFVMDFFGGAVEEAPSGTIIGTGVNLKTPGKHCDITVPDTDLQRGTFIFGTTGVGKTRLAENLIEQDIREGRNVVYFDPKGDQKIFAKILEVARQTGRLEDLMMVTPVYPEYSSLVDPLAYYYMPEELVGHIISGVPCGKDPFFRNLAKEIVTAIILAQSVLSRAAGKKHLNININDVRCLIRRDGLELMREQLVKLASDEAQDIARSLEEILSSDQNYYSKVSSSLRTCLAELSLGNIGKIIGKADSNRFMERLEKGEQVILIVHTGSMLAREAGATLGKVILSMIQSYIGRVYLSDKQKLDRELSIHIDESQSLLFEGIEDMFAKAGSAGVRMTAYAQSVNQIYDAVGELKGKSILDNTNTKIFLRCSDAETAEYVVKHFGVRTKLTGVYGPGGTVGTRETEEDVLKVQDVLDLQPQEFFMMTYKGRFKGRTIESWDPEHKVQFPAAPSNDERDDH